MPEHGEYGGCVDLASSGRVVSGAGPRATRRRRGLHRPRHDTRPSDFPHAGWLHTAELNLNFPGPRGPAGSARARARRAPGGITYQTRQGEAARCRPAERPPRAGAAGRAGGAEPGRARVEDVTVKVRYPFRIRVGESAYRINETS